MVVTCLCFGVKFLVTKKLPVVLFWMTITLPLGVLREDGERWREFPVSDLCIWGFIKKTRPFNHIFAGDRILRA